MEENFEEAISAVLKSLNPPSLTSNLRSLFEMDECRQPTKDSVDFWFVAAAIRRFFEKHGVLPLPGSLPDMKATSQGYIVLQNIYKSKARQDVAEISDTVSHLEKSLGRSRNVPEAEIEAFCKGAAHVKVLHGCPLYIPELGVAQDAQSAKTLYQSLSDPESLTPIYLSLQVLDSYASSEPAKNPCIAYHSSSPNSETSALSEFTARLQQLLSELKNAASKVSNAPLEDLDDETQQRVIDTATEVLRSGGAELHNISALTGGMVAQEVIKVITKQYIPVDNTCVFDGITSRSQVLRLGATP